ncbi:hypothetical protein [Nocardioides montaniterrae]
MTVGAGVGRPDPETFRIWLLLAGWEDVSRGPRGAMLRWGDELVAIPDRLAEDHRAAWDVAERVAETMGESRDFVWKRLSSPRSDRVQFRLVGENLPSGRLPLGAASDALKNARKLLSASGTSVKSPTRYIGRRYLPEAQLVAREAELAHTEDGSFIFPLYVSLGTTEEPLRYDGDVVFEPYERQVTRALSNALARSVAMLDGDVDRIPESDLDAASAVGVSRELCVAVDDLLRHELIEKVEVSFDWSAAYGAATGLTRSVTIPRESRSQYRRLANRLGKPAVQQTSVFSGSLLQIGHSSDEAEPAFFCVLDTYDESIRTELRISLTPDEHQRAIRWYDARATVVVQGQPVRSVSGLSMPKHDRIEAWVTEPLPPGGN